MSKQPMTLQRNFFIMLPTGRQEPYESPKRARKIYHRSLGGSCDICATMNGKEAGNASTNNSSIEADVKPLHGEV
jgi:hypothetical protein